MGAKYNRSAWVRFAVANLTVCGLVLGCSSVGTRRVVTQPTKGIVVSPLAIEVREPAKLLSVNSLIVEKPQFVGPSRSSISEDALRTVVEEIALRTLSMKVVVGKTRTATPDRADGSLRTEIITLEDLKGSAVGGEPARVAFRIAVYPAGGVRPVWQARYVYSQEAVADNWLRLGERLGSAGTGAGWISAEEIFKRGVTASLEDLNTRRDAQFQVSRRVP